MELLSFGNKGWGDEILLAKLITIAVAITALFIGFIFAASTIWNVSLMNFQSYSWIIGASISSLTYYFLTSK